MYSPTIVQVEKRRLRPRSHAAEMFHAEHSQAKEHSPAGPQTLWLVSERIGDKLSMDRSSILSSLESALNFIDLLLLQGRRFFVGRIDCDCGGCTQSMRKSTLHCEIVPRSLAEIRKEAKTAGISQTQN